MTNFFEFLVSEEVDGRELDLGGLYPRMDGAGASLLPTGANISPTVYTVRLEIGSQ